MKSENFRKESFGETSELSIIDKFGIYLSERKIKKRLNINKNMSLLDLGCGYKASLLKKLSTNIACGVGVDISIDDRIALIPNIKIYKQPIEEAVVSFNDKTFDVILIISVLEHLNDPLYVLKECKRILKNDGILIINVPTWAGKFFLEFSAFYLKLSPEVEMDDHKMYYNKRDLWPVIVKSGFKPSAIKMEYHKFGLNLFATIKNSK